MWDYQIARHIARAFQLMLDPSSKKTPVDETQKPAGVIQYRLANGALVSHAEGGEGLKMTLSFPGGTVTVEVICERCRKCKEVLFPDKGKYCAHCGASQVGGKHTTLDRRPWGMAERPGAQLAEHAWAGSEALKALR